jgi:hypothetical protein
LKRFSSGKKKTLPKVKKTVSLGKNKDFPRENDHTLPLKERIFSSGKKK